jgi:hypothetical protein
MDKDRVKQLCETILEMSFSGTTICDFDMKPTYEYINETNKWVPDSHVLFIQIKLVDSISRGQGTRDIQTTLEGLLGFECCIDFT